MPGDDWLKPVWRYVRVTVDPGGCQRVEMGQTPKGPWRPATPEEEERELPRSICPALRRSGADDR